MDAVEHVVLGAGAVGMAVAEALVRRGESMRVVNRSGLREPVPGVRSVAGDITDPGFAASATRGGRVIYQALNPPYHRWTKEFPGLQAAAITAAQAAGARLVVMDNVYMYGRANGQPSRKIAPTTPTPARAASVPQWPATSWPPTTPVAFGSPWGGVGLLRATRRRAVAARRLGHPPRSPTGRPR